MPVLPAWLAMKSARLASARSALALELRRCRKNASPALEESPASMALIGRPGRMELATLPLRLYQRLGVRRLVYSLGLRRCRGRRRLRDLEAMLPRLPRRPLRQVLPEVSPAQGASRRRVGFFLGCAQSLLFADASARHGARPGAQRVHGDYTARHCLLWDAGLGLWSGGPGDASRRGSNIALFEQAQVDCDHHRLRHVWLNAQRLRRASGR